MASDMPVSCNPRLVEQNANLALEISSYGYVLETGRIILEDKSAALRENPQVKSAYLGG